MPIRFKTPSALAIFATLLAFQSPAHASSLANDQANFEAFTKANQTYVFFAKDNTRNCHLNISLTDKDGHPQSDTSTCNTLYSLGKASGEREFIFFTEKRVLSVIAPPGGTRHEDGTHWTVSEVTIFSRNHTEPTVHWKTPGTCVSKPSEKISCLINDGKVKITVEPTTLTNIDILPALKDGDSIVSHWHDASRRPTEIPASLAC